MTSAERDALSGRLGAATFPVVQVMWVADFGTRAELALAHLFGPALAEVGAPPSPAALPDLWPAIDAFLVEVARLDHLDPMTTELVRLRGARAHNCRLCRSRRLLAAVQAGADEATFDQIDRYEHSDLAEHHKVALRLTDAMIWSPGAWPADLADQVRQAYDPAAAVELVLDVTRNSANKIAVALGADAAQVADGELELLRGRCRRAAGLGAAPGLSAPGRGARAQLPRRRWSHRKGPSGSAHHWPPGPRSVVWPSPAWLT